MADEAEYQQRKQEFKAALEEIGVQMDDEDVEIRLRRIQARAQEHEVPMDEIMRQNLVRKLFNNREDQE